MSFEVTEFSREYLKEASELVYEAQQDEFNSNKINHKVSLDFCEKQIINELNKEVSSSHIILSGGKLAGFAIGIINKDSIWGNSGWVNIGGWGIKNNRINLLNSLYQKIAEKFVDLNIKQHYFQVYDNNKNIVDLFNELGFAKQQTYGALNLKDFSINFSIDNNLFVVRKGNLTDQFQISDFSRLIADHQTKSPCFAPAPIAYLEALDEGFQELTSDPDVDLYVIEENNKIIGYQAFYNLDRSSLIVPPNSIELAVSGIKEKYRGKGAGFYLTAYSLNAQRIAGYSFAVIDWRCANLLSSNFWKRVGFKPLAHRLLRQIDPLI
jgi:ribosomal protein S18 acetylase RimI-like enzyme